MLPILRIIPIGGVLLAVLIVVLALEPPGSNPPPAVARSRAPLVVADDHPEWRQFLIQAALRRADEVSRLRDLPSAPTRVESAPEPEKASAESEAPKDQVAGLPTARGDSDPEEQSSAITETPSATIPVDIGETSRFELPITAPEEKLPPAKPQLKPPTQSRGKPAEAHKAVVKKRTAKRTRPAAKPQTAQQSDPFAAIFGGDQRYQQPGPPSARRSASQNQ